MPTEQQIQTLAKVVEQMNFQSKTPKNLEDAKKKHYQFWDTQPVPKIGTYSTICVGSGVHLLW